MVLRNTVSLASVAVFAALPVVALASETAAEARSDLLAACRARHCSACREHPSPENRRRAQAGSVLFSEAVDDPRLRVSCWIRVRTPMSADCPSVSSRGAVVVFPTDTVYGIGCSAACASSVARVFSAKHRDAAKPLPVFVPDIVRVLPWIDQPYGRWPSALPAHSGREHSRLWLTSLGVVSTHSPASPRSVQHWLSGTSPRGAPSPACRWLVMAQTSLNESGETCHRESGCTRGRRAAGASRSDPGQPTASRRPAIDGCQTDSRVVVHAA